MSDTNYSGGRKPAKNFRLDRGGVSGHTGPFIGEVMQTEDVTHSGRIRVWLELFGDVSTKHDETSWVTCDYLSPYYGVTPHDKINAPESNFDNNGQSYGMWMNAPDVGVKVLVVFAEGDPNKGYYIGYIPEPQMNFSIPTNSSTSVDNVIYNNQAEENKYSFAADNLPVTDIDKSEKTMNSSNFLDTSKPIQRFVAAQMYNAGLLRDSIRGPITSSAQRESPSRVFGFNTPGRPIYNADIADGPEPSMLGGNVRAKVESGEVTDISIKGRRGGHSFVMDDGDVDANNNLIRLRTSSGHQITMSVDGETIYVAHGSGNCWIELGKEGTIDGWAANSVNFRSGGDINLHADKDVNVNAGNKINMFAKKDLTIETETKLVLTGKQSLTAFSSAKVGIKSDGTIALDAGSAGSFKAGASINLKGSRIGLNDGSAVSVTSPSALTQNSWKDPTFAGDSGWGHQPSAEFKSVVTRAPTHEPYNDHNGGVKK